MPEVEELEQDTTDEKTPFDDEIQEENDSQEDTESVKPAPLNPRHFPTPSRKELKPQQFFHFCRELPKWTHERFLLYVNREIPRLDITKTLNAEQIELYRKNPRRFPKYIDKLGKPFESDDWKKEILRRWGSGTYKFYLNEGAIPGRKAFPQKELCRTGLVEVYDSEFPAVVDLMLLDMDHPNNQSYIRDLMLKGIIAPDKRLTGKSPEDETMAQAAMEAMAQTVDKLTDKLTKPQPAPANNNGVSADATLTTVMSIVEKIETRHAEESRRAEERHRAEMAILEKRLQEAHATPPTPAIDPMAVFTAMTTAVKNLIPAPAPPPPPATEKESPMVTLLMQLRKEESERHTAEMAVLQKRLETIEARANPPAQQPGNTIEKAIDGALSIQEKLERLSGKGNTGPAWLPAVIEMGEMALGATQNIVYNLAAMKNGTKPVAPIVDAEQTGAQPAPQQIAQTEEEKQVDQMRIFAGLIHPALVESLRNGVPGYVFAGRLMAQYQPAAYDTVLAMGYNGIMGDRGLLRLDPVKFGQLREAVMPKMERLDEFVNEFLDSPKAYAAYQEIMAQRQGRPAQQASPPARPNGPAPASTEQQPARKVMGPDGKLVEVKPPVA